MVRSLAVSLILVWCASAGERTSIAVGADRLWVGQPIRLSAVVWTAIVSVHPITGTVEFTNDGTPIPGCTAVPLIALHANCEATFLRGGTFTLGGTYSGDAWWAASTATGPLSIRKYTPGVYVAF